MLNTRSFRLCLCLCLSVEWRSVVPVSYSSRSSMSSSKRKSMT